MNNRAIAFYLGSAYCLSLLLFSQFIRLPESAESLTWLFASLVLVTGPAIFMLPALLVFWFSGRPHHPEARIGGRWVLLIWLLSALVNLFLFADAKLFDLYGFHINGFVINLMMTPGGIQSLGASDGAYLMSGVFGTGIFLLHLLLLKTSERISHWQFPLSGRQLMSAMVLLLVVEKGIYAWSDLENYGPVLNQAAAVPLYKGVTARKMAGKLGYKAPDRHEVQLGNTGTELNYPLAPLQLSPPPKRPNLIFLVAESLRWDMLTPEIMPNTWAFKDSSLYMTQHYSGGNGTRQGLFSLMYGLHGSYWDAFLRAQRGPVLTDALQAADYEFLIQTSASFTYPEFDQTLFVNIPDSDITEADEDLAPWLRDEQNTDRMVRYIEQRDSDQPFMMFMFFESTHARYDFPEQAAIRRPYLESLNYATMSRDSLRGEIDQLFNRYVNASHWVDVQLGRVIDSLKARGLLENSIVIITGDHGEEFMENGFWGHNSGFSEWQVRVPMVVHLPGETGKEISHITSHLDLIPSIAPLLGIANPLADYTVGLPLAQSVERQNIVISDWHGVALVNESYKFTIPLRATLQSRNQLFTRDDKLLDDPALYLQNNQGDLQRVLQETRRFSQSSAG